MRSAAQVLAELMRDRAHISARADLHHEASLIAVKLQDLKRRISESLRASARLACLRAPVCMQVFRQFSLRKTAAAFAASRHGIVQRLRESARASKPASRVPPTARPPHRRCLLQIRSECGRYSLFRGREILRQARKFAQQQRQHAGRHGIQRAQVPDRRSPVILRSLATTSWLVMPPACR